MKIGMLFPGYASQFVGMGKELYDDSRIMQEYFEEASSVLNMNFVKLCFASSDAELARMENAYPSLFLVSSAIAAYLKQEGIQPEIVAGYNSGEYAAIQAAGGFSLPDGLYLLAKYQTFYQEILANLSVSGIQILGLPTAQVQELCTKATTDSLMANIAVYDSPVQHTVMGNTQTIEQIRSYAMQHEDVEIDDEPLEVGLHSSLMDPVALNFKVYLEKVDFKDLPIQLVTNADAKIITHGDIIKAAVVKQIHSPVLWYQSLELLNYCDLIIEVGPGTYLTAMAQARYPEKKCVAINKKSDLEELKKYIELHQQQPVEQPEV